MSSAAVCRLTAYTNTQHLHPEIQRLKCLQPPFHCLWFTQKLKDGVQLHAGKRYKWQSGCSSALSCQHPLDQNWVSRCFTPALFSSVKSNWLVSPLVCFIWVSEHSIQTRLRTKTTRPRPVWKGGLGPITNKLWSGSFLVWTWSDPNLPQLHNCTFLD